MTSKHHETMIKIVTKEINRVYKLFIERNPHFLKKNGQVTLFAHSLGASIPSLNDLYSFYRSLYSLLIFSLLNHSLEYLTPKNPSHWTFP